MKTPVAEDLVLYHSENRIAYITLNRPDKRNALSPQLVEALKSAFIKAMNDDQLKVVILRASGKAFSAGADLAYLQELTQNTLAQNVADSESLSALFRMIYEFPKVVIAQVEGAAIAGGCGLLTVCDFVFATPESKFGYTEVRIGFVPAIVAGFLMRKVQESKAKDWLLTGRLFDAAEALQFNLISHLSAPTEIATQVEAFAQQLCMECSEQSLILTKNLIQRAQDLPLDDFLAEAIQANAQVRMTPDFNKGVSAFLDKEQLKW